VVRHVVAEVVARRGVDGREPDGIDAQRSGRAVVQVIEASRDPCQVTDAVTVGIGEAPWVDLVDNAPSPPVVVHWV
jgi:hypothetical protein